MTSTTDLPPRGELAASARRTWGLARANGVLMTRNRLTLFYGLLMPLLPVAFMIPAERGDVTIGATSVVSVLMLAWLFSVFYNLLSMVVTRRDELVLKRLRTGETRDLELLASLALPGIGIVVAVTAVLVGIGAGFGLPMPVNVPLYAATVLVGCALFVAFAIWTAAWTNNAEAAQMTSMPVLALAIGGTLQATFSGPTQAIVEWTPGAALDTLVRVSWFGLGRDGDVGFAGSWGASAQPLLVVAIWIALAVWLARRSMRWEPRS